MQYKDKINANDRDYGPRAHARKALRRLKGLPSSDSVQKVILLDTLNKCAPEETAQQEKMHCTPAEYLLIQKAAAATRGAADALIRYKAETEGPDWLLKLGLWNYKAHPFEYRIYNLPDHDIEKQAFVLSEASLVLFDACCTYNPYKSNFDTWLSFKFNKLWGGKSQDEWKKENLRKAARCIVSGHSKKTRKGSSIEIDHVQEFTIGAMVEKGSKTIWHECTFGNANEVCAEIYAKDVINKITDLKSLSRANKNNLSKLLTGYGKYDSVYDIADANDCSPETLYRTLRKTHDKITPEILDTYKAYCEQPHAEESSEAHSITNPQVKKCAA